MNDRDTMAFVFAGVVILCGLVAYLMGKAAGKLDRDCDRIFKNGHVDDDEDNDFSEIGYSDIKKKHEAENQNQG